MKRISKRVRPEFRDLARGLLRVTDNPDADEDARGWAETFFDILNSGCELTERGCKRVDALVAAHGGRKPSKTIAPNPGVGAIAVAQSALVELLIATGRVQPGLEARTCWACGLICDEFRPFQAHIHARRLGGSVAPDNFFLLCGVCHIEQDDTLPREEAIAWLFGERTLLPRLVERFWERSP